MSPEPNGVTKNTLIDSQTIYHWDRSRKLLMLLTQNGLVTWAIFISLESR